MKVTSNKTYLDTSTSAFSYSVGYSSSWGIDHGHEADKSEASQGEVGIIRVILVAWGVLVNGQHVVRESWNIQKHSFILHSSYKQKKHKMLHLLLNFRVS